MAARLLVVEQNAELLTVVVELLADAGFEVSGASGVGEAREALGRARADLVLTAFQLVPGSESWDAVESIQAEASPAPVALMTGWRITNDEAERRGFAFLLKKPFASEELLEAVATHLPERALGAGEVAAVRGYFRALDESAWDALGRLCTADVVYHLPGDHPRFSRTVRGREDFQRFAESTFAQYPDVRFEVRAMAGLPNGAVVRYHGEWRAASGGRSALDGAVRFRFRGVEIAEIGVRLDVNALAAVSP
jgi:CheY-like chemotaxis protein/ketosteroid isomerase-like protein